MLSLAPLCRIHRSILKPRDVRPATRSTVGSGPAGRVLNEAARRGLVLATMATFPGKADLLETILDSTAQRRPWGAHGQEADTHDAAGDQRKDEEGNQ